MVAIPKLIYCANGNPRFAEIAVAAGFSYGAQLPGSVPAGIPLAFADQNWKAPNRSAYMAALARHRPAMASVLDWEREDQFGEVLDWAEEAAQFAGSVMIIPKIVGSIGRIPCCVGGKPVVIGYSIPTKHGGTPCVWWEFQGRQVHILGGSPHAQMRDWDYLRRVADVVSVDGNMTNLMAVRHNKFWERRGECKSKWRTLRDANNGILWGEDAPYEAFRRSCENVRNAWLAIRDGLQNKTTIVARNTRIVRSKSAPVVVDTLTPSLFGEDL